MLTQKADWGIWGLSTNKITTIQSSDPSPPSEWARSTSPAQALQVSKSRAGVFLISQDSGAQAF